MKIVNLYRAGSIGHNTMDAVSLWTLRNGFIELYEDKKTAIAAYLATEETVEAIEETGKNDFKSVGTYLQEHHPSIYWKVREYTDPYIDGFARGGLHSEDIGLENAKKMIDKAKAVYEAKHQKSHGSVGVVLDTWDTIKK